MTDVKEFISVVGNPMYADKRQVITWYENESLGAAPATTNRKLAAIRAFYRFLQLREIRDDDPTVLLDARKQGRRLPKPIPHEDIVRILNYAREKRNESIWRVQDVAILEVLYGSGVRAGECARLTTTDIFSREVLHVQAGKGDKERLTILTEPAYWAILEWRHAYVTKEPWAPVYRDKLKQDALEMWFKRNRIEVGPSPLFVSPQKGLALMNYRDPAHQIWLRIRVYAEELELKIHPHQFRHSFGTELTDNGASLQDLADVMGHVSVQTTRGYVDRGERGLRLIRQKHSRTLEQEDR